jgi:ribonuclease T2
MKIPLGLILLSLAFGRPAVSQNIAGKFDHFVVALSWEPAYCETAHNRPECRSMTRHRFDASHLILHGLQPDKHQDPQQAYAYCGVAQFVIDNRPIDF